MIKILSGEFKGRKLNKINLSSVRPTQAKVRKSVMDSIRNFEKKKVLDLYSGPGTLGIECISRGANSVCFVEKDYKTIQVLKKNINMLELNSRCVVIKDDAINFIKKNEEKYDIIFADPPYGTCSFNDIFSYIPNILKTGGVFCFEEKKNKLKIKENVKIKYYGNTQVVFWEK